MDNYKNRLKEIEKLSYDFFNYFDGKMILALSSNKDIWTEISGIDEEIDKIDDMIFIILAKYLREDFNDDFYPLLKLLNIANKDQLGYISSDSINTILKMLNWKGEKDKNPFLDNFCKALYEDNFIKIQLLLNKRKKLEEKKQRVIKNYEKVFNEKM